MEGNVGEAKQMNCPKCGKRYSYWESWKIWNPMKYVCPYCSSVLRIGPKSLRNVLAISCGIGLFIALFAVSMEERAGWKTADSMMFFGIIFPVILVPLSYACWRLVDLVEVKKEYTANGTETIRNSTCENEKMKTTESLESIASTFRKLVLILSVPCGVFSLFLVFIMIFIIYSERIANNENRVEVVVANTNLVTGVEMSRANLGSKKFRSSYMKTQDYVAVKDAKVVFGHRILAPVGFGEPITWHNTDIVVTNIVPQPGDTPNPHSPSAQGAGGR
jgi:DNA-directed RNA polymerase subunit RPC12/RpoP